MCGRETLTTVVSSTSMKVLGRTATAMIQGWMGCDGAAKAWERSSESGMRLEAQKRAPREIFYTDGRRRRGRGVRSGCLRRGRRGQESDAVRVGEERGYGIAADAEGIEAGHTGSNRRGSVAGEKIEGDVMMVAVPGKKAEVAPVGGEAQTKQFVERLRGVEIAHGKMHVAEAGGLGKGVPLRPGGTGEFAQIERESSHGDVAAGPFPGSARAVGVNLDAVFFGIGEVKRFTDEMIGGADEIPAMAGSMAEEGAERGAVGQKNGKVIEAGGAFRARLAIGKMS